MSVPIPRKNPRPQKWLKIRKQNVQSKSFKRSGYSWLTMKTKALVKRPIEKYDKKN